MHKTLNADVSGASLPIAVFAVETECLIDVDRPLTGTIAYVTRLSNVRDATLFLRTP
jgi:hypothetical protein